MDNEEFTARLKVLTENYLHSLPGRMLAIDALWTKLRAGRHSEDAWHELHRTVHSLAGSGTTFGYPDISRSARAAEQLLKLLSQEQRLPDSAERDHIDRHLDELRRVISDALEQGAG